MDRYEKLREEHMKNMFEFQKRKKKKFFITLIIFVVMLSLLIGFYILSTNVKTVSYNEFLTMAENREVSEIVINYDNNTFDFYVDGTKYQTTNPRYDNFTKDMLSYDIEITEKSSSKIGSWLASLASSLIVALLCTAIVITVGVFLLGSAWSAITSVVGGEMKHSENPNSSGSVGTYHKDHKVKFKDVAGLHEVKQDLMGVVDMLKNPKKYDAAGARISKGAILYGPPGTGKTLLARAVAGEAGVNFISVSGSDFSNKFMGAAADRVRQLFNNAKKMAPCIVFIDEIDAVGGTRDGAHEERKNTIDALLTCMDGFDKRDGIFIIAATNRLEDLDSALVRPGRFDNKFAVPLPSTTEERLEVIEVYKKGKTFDNSVDFTSFAKQLIGSSPADIEAIMNEAAILAARKNGIISKDDLEEAYLKKILKGHVKNEDKDTEVKRLVAYHEAGHALIGVLTGQEVTKVTAQSTTSGAGGFTLTAPSKMGLFSKKELEAQVLQLYGGRAAEELLVGKENITTGASNDIEVATNTLYHIVAKLGMSEENAIINYERIPGGDKIVAEKVCELASNLYKKSVQMLVDNKDKLDNLANALIERESLCESEILDIVKG